jgi:imidazolonepropionase-like amidohydrolase
MQLQKSRVAIALALALCGGAQAQSDVTWVHAGQLLETPLKKPRGESWIGIQAGKIIAIQSNKPADISTAQIVDLSDQFVLPGLIDCHVHLASDKAGIEGQLEQVTQSTPAAAYQALRNAHKTLAAGFTTVRNLGDGDGVTLALRDAINAGELIGPRIVDAGTSISVSAGHMDPRLGFAPHLQAAMNQAGNLCDGADDCRRAVRTQIARGVDVIKIATTGGVNSRIGAGLGQQMFEDEARAIVNTAHMAGKKVAVHAHGSDGVALALKVGADSIEHGTLLDAAGMRLMKSNGAFLVATMSTINGYKARLAANPDAYDAVVKPKILWRLSVTGKSFKQAHQAGVKIAYGTDAGVSMHGRNADEFALMLEHGMTPAQALAAATQNAAELLGLDKEIGSIAVGKQADMIAVASSPLTDMKVLTQVQHVIKGGRLVHSPDRPLIQQSK